MESEQLITKITQTLKRPDGSEVRIVVQQSFGLGLTPSLGVYVLRRPTTVDNWQLCKNTPHKDWRTMSVDEYQKHGRSENAAVRLHRRNPSPKRRDWQTDELR